MTVYRTINGVECGFVLSEQELTAAYYEKQHEFDVEDVAYAIESEEDSFFEECYGCSKAEALEESETIAQMYRERLDDSIEYTSIIYDILSRLLG